MAHPEQATFCKSVKAKYPDRFINPDVLDVGSLDINGNNRYLFEGGHYLGIDVGFGNNVDIVSRGHLFRPGRKYDVVISTECFEHDQHWRETIVNCVYLTKPGGLFMFSCATEGRQEHGTTRTTPQDSPFTHSLFNDYYMNLTEKDILSIEGFADSFQTYGFSINLNTKDLYFFGIKKIP